MWALAIDSSNNLYTNNGSQVLRLSPNAQSVLFTYPQQFADILSLTVDTSSGATAGYLYVASYLAGTISVLSPNGTLVRVYSVPPGPFNLSTISGAEISQMSLIGSTGSLLATDIFNGVAYVFSSAGSILFNYTLPSSQILFCGTADAAGNLYLAISDADPLGYAVNGRIIKLAAPGYTQTSTVVTESAHTRTAPCRPPPMRLWMSLTCARLLPSCVWLSGMCTRPPRRCCWTAPPIFTCSTASCTRCACSAPRALRSNRSEEASLRTNSLSTPQVT